MLTQTSETAIRALIYLALANPEQPMTPREIAEHLSTSPSYMAKITHHLVRANLLRSQRGASGGVLLERDPRTITLLAIVEACQGLLVGNYCEEIEGHMEPVCAFHQAMKEAHLALVSVLSRWTLADLVRQPGPTDKSKIDHARCKMGFIGLDGKVLPPDRVRAAANHGKEGNGSGHKPIRARRRSR